ncbi:MAG: ATP-binding protein [Deltaproteobacteria bacterium]|nr:ATP-binding protein [Deltaproteobacteria bacterium]
MTAIILRRPPARQVGKTTLLRQAATLGLGAAASERKFVTLDDPLTLQLAREDPGLFLQRFAAPVLIDEIQYAPGLLSHIKMAVDANPGRGGQFWLSGSQPFHLMRGVSESLAGRVVLVELQGLSRQEALGQGEHVRPFLPDVEQLLNAADNPPLLAPALYEQIWRGSYPAIVTRPELDHDRFYASYVQTYLQRDLRDLARVGDEMAFLRFLRAAAARTAGLVNLADMARDADISPVTAKVWLSILQASGVVTLLEPWHTNVSKRLVKAPKLHFADTGLCAWLTGWTSPETLAAGAMAGPILETWVVGEILKTWKHNARSVQAYHLRDRDQREIDLLLVRDGKAWPIEVKRSAAPTRQDAKHFGLLDQYGLQLATGAVVCLVPTPMPLTANVWAVPVGAL